ncbi:MAG: ParB/RepB/Spo0J family partition protein, partial [Ruminococcus sp.]|nr:ParB/RepB/Spo0J family partition protein [Ruminococcus sp.]
MAIGGLGAGLDSLFSDNTSAVQVKKTLRTSEIEPNREQPRKKFSDEAITSLADSIREHGMLQPILVRPLSSGGYQIVAGERRWRAARMLGLDEVPVNIRELSDSETMQIAIIENLQRENLNPVEEANGYNELIEKYGMTQDKVAKMVGRSRSSVANAIRILTLPEAVL